MNHRLDQYLWNIEDYLRALPDADRKREVFEIQQHLAVLIDAAEADGQTPDGATRAAIAQFGTSREIGSRLRRAQNRKRLGLMVDVVLLCTVLSDVFNLLTWGIGSVGKTVILLPAECKEMGSFVGPPYWGLAGLIGLLLRHGIRRGTWRKMLSRASPLLPAAGFFLLENLVVQSWNVVEMYRSHIYPVNGLGSWETGHLVLHHFGLCWLAAYAVGRFSTFRGSVADAVGTAAAFVPAAGLLTVAIAYMPTLTQIVQKLLRCLMAIGLWVVPGTLFVLCVRFGVHVGEKSRRALVSAFQEGNSYEPAV